MKKKLRIVNASNNTVLVDQGRIADDLWSRLRGLIGVRNLMPGDGLLITRCKGVHCLFMSIAIDVLYVNRADCIVDVDPDMRPWAVGKLRRRSSYVVELPAGTIARTATGIGDRLAVTSMPS